MRFSGRCIVRVGGELCWHEVSQGLWQPLAGQPHAARRATAASIAYSCKVLNSSVHTPRACMLGRACPEMPLVSFGGQQSVYTSSGADCAMRCDFTPGCRAFASSRCQVGSSEMGDCIRCYLYDRIVNITETRLGSEATREPRYIPRGEPLRVCALQGSSGCSQPTLPPRNRTLIRMLVMKHNTHNLVDWMNYHRVLGVRHFVIISNECEEQEHRHLVATAASVPCMPRLSFINSFRCATVFQSASYREAVDCCSKAGRTRTRAWASGTCVPLGRG